MSKGKTMKYDYTALINQPRHGLHWDELVAEGWCEWMKIPYWTRPHRCGPGPSYVYVMRRPKEKTMEYEYVALSWNKEHDEVFAKRKAKLIDQGWKVHAQACWQDTYTGACIMRRPKDSCKPECCVEEEETCIEKTLLVLPIYNAYLKKMCWDSEQALRLTFIEVQRRVEHALTWPNR